MKAVYPAVFHVEESGWFIEFPDVENAFTQSDSLFEGLELAEDALEGMLAEMENSGEKIPSPRPLSQVEVQLPDFVTLIKADTEEWRKKNVGR